MKFIFPSKLNSIVIVLSALLLFLTQVSLADEPLDGAKLFAQHCLSCHNADQSLSNRAAPPIVAVKNHYIEVHDDQESFVKAIVEWVTEPTPGRTLMRGAIKRFGLMPAMPNPAEEIAAIADFIFTESMDKPDWYDKHYEEEHGTAKQ